jgi:hypothetical protein
MQWCMRAFERNLIELVQAFSNNFEQILSFKLSFVLQKLVLCITVSQLRKHEGSQDIGAFCGRCRSP